MINFVCYHKLKATGSPYFPPYWSLGFQLCRYGYGNVSRVRTVLAEMRAYDIPQVTAK